MLIFSITSFDMTKPTLVLIPGLLCDDSVWQHQLSALKHDVNILVLKVSQLETPEAMIQYIIDNSPQKFYLAGHSMGGWLALELMRHHSSRVLKLCILASSASLDSPEKTKLRRECIKLMSTISAQKLAHLLSSMYSHRSDIVPLIEEMFNRNIKDLIPQQEAMLNRVSCEDVLPKIKIQTTVIVGEFDKEFYNSSKQIADIVPNANFGVIKGCGHMLMLEEPESTTKAMVSWVRGCSKLSIVDYK